MPTATFSSAFLLRRPTEDELIYIRTLHASCWAGPLTVSQYLFREAHIASTPLTRDGGMMQWVLVDSSDSESAVLASCETIRKMAAMSYPQADSEKEVLVKEVTAYGIGSVFTPPECRGKGYAKTMLMMLAERLKGYNDEVVGFSALYSDIGKEFYTKLGWLPHRSSHIDITVAHVPAAASSGARVQPLLHADIPSLCTLDIASVRQHLSSWHQKPRIAFLPDHGSLDWHHNREDFIASCVRPTQGIPKVKGCITADGQRWILWGRDFSLDDPKLYVLRIVNLGDEEGRARDMDAMLSAAVEEARSWGLNKVCVWNPEQWVLESVERVVGGAVVVVDREMESVASLMMYGEKVGSGVGDVDWVVNEKFAWC